MAFVGFPNHMVSVGICSNAQHKEIHNPRFLPNNKDIAATIPRTARRSLVNGNMGIIVEAPVSVSTRPN
jgi:hypothetical protein